MYVTIRPTVKKENVAGSGNEYLSWYLPTDTVRSFLR